MYLQIYMHYSLGCIGSILRVCLETASSDGRRVCLRPVSAYCGQASHEGGVVLEAVVGALDRLRKQRTQK